QQIILYGEWAGEGIQKGVGISELNKSFYIFDTKIYDKDLDKSEWINCYQDIMDFKESPYNELKAAVTHIENFQTFKIDIDFNKPQEYQNKLIEITEEVEKECPVSKLLGVK